MRLSRRATKIVFIAAVALICLLGAAAILLWRFWPFSESKVRSRLASAASAEVSFRGFHEKYFPPGCVAENVVFQRQGSDQPVITIQRLVVRSSVLGLFHHHISLIRAESMHVLLGHSDFAATKSSGQSTTVDQLNADGAVLEVRQGSGRPLRFDFQKFRLENLGTGGQTKFAAIFQNPMPAGLIRTSGTFGPWNASKPAATAVSGAYSLENADLGVFHAVAGRISSQGDFKGTFESIAIEGSTNTPELEVTSTHHELPLHSRFSATVDAISGDTVLRAVNASLGRDELEVHGNIGRQTNGKRGAVVEITCERGRVEDTFYPFIESPRSPINGNVRFQMHVLIPPGHERFMEKVQFQSQFQILNAKLTNPQTESRLAKVAEKPGQKEEDDSASAKMEGVVSVSRGIAHFSRLMIKDGDGSARFGGMYNLINDRVNMHGYLATEASLGKTTSGIKAAFAKVLQPLFKKGPHKKVIPVKITGSYHHPNFGLDLGSKM